MASRRSLRKTAMFCLYQYLLLKKDIREILEDMCEKQLAEIDPYILDCVIECLENQASYIETINMYLNEWSFERLGYVEQAILLLSVHEITAQKAEKPIIINEAVELSKEFCDDVSFKFINGVLDRL